MAVVPKKEKNFAPHIKYLEEEYIELNIIIHKYHDGETWGVDISEIYTRIHYNRYRLNEMKEELGEKTLQSARVIQ